ncbi:OLC1v1019524C1 [Oldenlandia corymbosa var. corymbosa]|uniref:OLC1v1019524C1 n=1 Tax=Oldenlandia corymbosa var. corymbosa TaxID=529605 RepID=A0AAV1EE96_OLDCO|nr:OLC1v1019524C1 [Oldenlandia corymbosa var. corymbosa]
MLRTEPSLSIYNNTDDEVVEETIGGNQNLEGKEESLKKDGLTSLGLGSHEFSFGKNDLALIVEGGNEGTLSGFRDLGIADESVVSSLPLDSGLEKGDGLGFDLSSTLEEHYRKMIREDPSNPLFLRNYAQLLQSKGDFSRAEEFYLRAALANPTDGEIQLQCANLVWQLHHDRVKAMKYFKRAALAAPEDSHVQAAYASFLWDIDEDEEGSSSSDVDKEVEEFGRQVDHCNVDLAEEKRPASPPLHLATGLGIDLAGFDERVISADCVTADYGDSVDDDGIYKRMIEENPSNPSILKNYARFLCQSRGDLQAAEEFYSRAIQVDPTDGEVIMQYAEVILQLHCDRHKASPYFKQAAEVAPSNSNVLAAYARFLWGAEEDEEED